MGHLPLLVSAELMFGKRDDPSDRVRLGTREDRAANTMCAPHMGHSVSRHRPVAMLCSYITLCVFHIKKNCSSARTSSASSYGRPLARSFVPRSESVNPVVWSKGPCRRGALLLSLSCFIIVVEEPHAVALGNANEAFERPRVSLGSPSAPVSGIEPNRPDERSATRGSTRGRLRAPAAGHRGARDFAAERRRQR